MKYGFWPDGGWSTDYAFAAAELLGRVLEEEVLGVHGVRCLGQRCPSGVGKVPKKPPAVSPNLTHAREAIITGADNYAEAGEEHRLSDQVLV